VLLGERGRERHRNVDTTRLHKLERRSQRLHEGLSRETASNFVWSSQTALLPSNEKEISHGQRRKQVCLTLGSRYVHMNADASDTASGGSRPAHCGDT
jgi:hypothetical protein